MPPRKGRDLVLTIDLETQRVAEKAFEGLSGSLVAIEPSSGEILAYISAPSYNLEEFASVTSVKNLTKFGMILPSRYLIELLIQFIHRDLPIKCLPP